MKLQLSSSGMLVALGVLGLGALGLYAWSKGGLGNVVKSAAGGLVNAAGEGVSGAVGAISTGIGIPTPDDTTTDPAVARWLIDRVGYFTASQWSSLPALGSAAFMPVGSGTPPPAGTKLAQKFGTSGGYIDYGSGAGWDGADQGNAGLTGSEQMGFPL